MDINVGIVGYKLSKFRKLINEFLAADPRRKLVIVKESQLDAQFHFHLLLFCGIVDIPDHLRAIAVSLDKFSTFDALSNYVEHKFPFVSFGASKSTSGEIPRIVHLMWLSGKDDPVPEKYRSNVERWRKSGYQVEIWNDSKVEKLMKDYLPWLLPTYLKIDRIICRCDIARFAIVYVHGGVYFDLDFYLHGDLDALIADSDLVLTNEPPEHLVGKSYNGLLINGAFAAAPRHEFIMGWLTTMQSNVDSEIASHGTIDRNRVLDVTGPSALYNYFTNQGHKYINESNIVSHCLVIPYTMTRKMSKDCVAGDHPIIAYTLWNEGTDWWGSGEDFKWWLKVIIVVILIVIVLVFVGIIVCKYQKYAEHQKLIQSI